MKNPLSSQAPCDYRLNRIICGPASLKVLFRLHSSLFTFILAISPVIINAQLVTVHDPTAQVTITGDQVREKSGFGSVLTTPAEPTEKGGYLISGASRFGLNKGSQKSKSDGSTSDGSKSDYFNLEFLPKAGYFFLDNLVGGLFIDVEIENFESEISFPDLLYEYSRKTTYFAIGPFARYYVPVSEKLLPFAEAQVGFGINNSSTKFSSTDDWSKSKQSVFTYRLGGGATYFINKIVGLDLFMGYLHDAYKYKDSEDSAVARSIEASDSKSIYSEFTFQLGIVIVLH